MQPGSLAHTISLTPTPITLSSNRNRALCVDLLTQYPYLSEYPCLNEHQLIGIGLCRIACPIWGQVQHHLSFLQLRPRSVSLLEYCLLVVVFCGN
jgi:hypothetical protein